MKLWINTVVKGASSPDPTVGVLGDEEVKNVSLRATLGRMLVTLPPGHLGRIDSRFEVRGLGVSPPAAGLLIKAAMATMLVAVAWRCRRKVEDRRDFSLVIEAAIVSLLLLIYSPITWKQHCVGAFPAVYLIARSAVARRNLPRWAVAVLAGYAFAVIGLDRGVVGPRATLILDSWGVTTWFLLGILAVALDLHSRYSARTASRVPGPHLAVQQGMNRSVALESRPTIRKILDT